MSSEETKKEAKAGCLMEILFLLVALLINVLVFGIAVFQFINWNIETSTALTVGIVLSVIYAIVVYASPSLRKNSYIRWLGFLAVADAAWWIYLLIG